MPISSFRLHAFLYHLIGSATLCLAGLWLVFFVWYPSPLHVAAGVTGIFLIVLGVDVSLGPLMTLVLANPRKKRVLFKLDMAVIITVQLAAFIYGIYTVSVGRPVWLVLNVDRFDLVRADEIGNLDIDKALEQFRSASWLGPQYAYVPPPKDSAENSAQIEEFLSTGMDIFQLPKLYRPFPEGKELITAKAQTLDELRKSNPPEEVNKILADNPDADAWLPLKSRVQPVTVLVNKAEGRVVKIVELDPNW
ncbi:MAG: hypothetical protein LBB76_07725 [Azoarcus sp.]|jgi:hypothetical protein|nr:hypothetical protein [Azoarcus sp.]